MPFRKLQPSKQFSSTSEGLRSLGNQNVSIDKPAETSFTSRASTAIQARGSKIADALTGTGQGQYMGESPIRRGVEATAEAFSAPVDVAFETLPKFARNGISKAGELIGKGFNAITNKIGDSKALQNWVAAHPDAAKNLEEIAGTGAAAGNIAGNILTVDAGAKVAQATGEKAAQAVQKAGAGAKNTGEYLYKKAIEPNTDEAGRIQTYNARLRFLEGEQKAVPKGSQEFKDITKKIEEVKASKPVTGADTALKKGLAGTEKQIGMQSEVEQMKLWKNNIEPALKNSKDTITKDELFAKARERVASEPEPGRANDLKKALDVLESEYKDFGNTDLLKANQIKSSLAKFTPSKIFKGQDIADTYKTLKADLASAIREKTYNSLGGEVKQAYLDYSNLKHLEEIGIKALTHSGFKGGSGKLIHSLLDWALTPIETVGGKTLYRVGNALEFTGKTGLKTLRQHIEDLGLSVLPKDANMQGGYAKNPLAGDTKFNVSPETVAPKMSFGDMHVARHILEKNDLNLYLEAQPMFEKLGIDKLSVKDQIDFLKEVVDLNTKKIPVKSR